MTVDGPFILQSPVDSINYSHKFTRVFVAIPTGSQNFVHPWYDPINPPKTNMTMENQPFEDVFPIENGDVPLSC